MSIQYCGRELHNIKDILKKQNTCRSRLLDNIAYQRANERKMLTCNPRGWFLLFFLSFCWLDICRICTYGDHFHSGFDFLCIFFMLEILRLVFEYRTVSKCIYRNYSWWNSEQARPRSLTFANCEFGTAAHGHFFNRLSSGMQCLRDVQL